MQHFQNVGIEASSIAPAGGYLNGFHARPNLRAASAFEKVFGGGEYHRVEGFQNRGRRLSAQEKRPKNAKKRRLRNFGSEGAPLRLLGSAGLGRAVLRQAALRSAWMRYARPAQLGLAMLRSSTLCSACLAMLRWT